jgi:catecholate siderophore receptor
MHARLHLLVLALVIVAGPAHAALPAVSGSIESTDPPTGANEASLEVLVLDPSGATVGGAEVLIKRDAGPPVALSESAFGRYRLPTIDPGVYLLTVVKSGFSAVNREVRVARGVETRVSVALATEGVSEVVTVEGTPFATPPVSSATRTPANVLDVPQSVEVVPRAVVQSQAALSMQDVLLNVSGVTPHMGEGRRDQVTIRGFTALNDTYVDGVRDDAKYYRDLSNLEQVEVVKGSAAALFGRGSSGGVVNRVTKKPIFGSPIAEVTAVAGSFDRRRLTADVGRPLGPALSFRLNAAWEDTESHRPFYSLERIAIAPALSWRPRQGAELMFQTELLRDDRVPDRGIPSFDGRPIDDVRENYYGDPAGDHLANRVASQAITWQQPLRGDWAIRSVFRYTHHDNELFNTYPSAVREVGGRLVVNRTHYTVDGSQRNLFSQTDVTTRAMTGGGIAHDLLVGVELGRQAIDTLRFNGTAPAVDLVAPILTPAQTPDTPSTHNEFTGVIAGLYVQDQITLGDRWRALVGARFDAYDQQQDDLLPANVDLGRIDRAFSPRVGLVYRTSAHGSVYASYSRSFQPSGEGLSLALNNAELEPEETASYEVGVKTELGRRLMLTAALFRLDRTNVKTIDPLDASRLVLVGRQQSDGVEVSMMGSLASGWDIRGGVTFLDPEILRSNDVSSGVRVEGNRIGAVATRTASLWTTYTHRSGVSVGGGAFYVGDWFTSNDNLVRVDRYTRVDATVAYRFTRVEIALNLRNLLDEAYYESSHGNTQIMPAAGRNGLVTLRYRW